MVTWGEYWYCWFFMWLTLLWGYLIFVWGFHHVVQAVLCRHSYQIMLWNFHIWYPSGTNGNASLFIPVTFFRPIVVLWCLFGGGGSNIILMIPLFVCKTQWHIFHTVRMNLMSRSGGEGGVRAPEALIIQEVLFITYQDIEDTCEF